MMIEFLENIGLTMVSTDAYPVLHKEFQINKKQFYYLRGKLTKNTSLSDYLKELKEKKYIVAFD